MTKYKRGYRASIVPTGPAAESVTAAPVAPRPQRQQQAQDAAVLSGLQALGADFARQDQQGGEANASLFGKLWASYSAGSETSAADAERSAPMLDTLAHGAEADPATRTRAATVAPPAAAPTQSERPELKDANEVLKNLVASANGEGAQDGRPIDAATCSNIMAVCQQVLTKVLQSNAASFNKTQPGRGDHVDNPPSVLLRNLKSVLTALTVVWQASTPAQQKALRPIMDRVHSKIGEMEIQSKPPYTAAEQNSQLYQRLGSRAPVHPASPPTEE